MDDFTDPSYHLPHFYELWALWNQLRCEFWQQAAVFSRAFFTKAAHPQAGLATAKIDDRSAEGELELKITAAGNTYSLEYAVKTGPWRILAQQVDATILSTRTAG